MKTLKKVLVMLLAAAMVFSLVACGGSGSGENADPAAETVKIGVLVSDTTSAEALAFRSYYENYIQSVYNVEFMYSDELSDAAAEQSALDNFIANNCKAIISFASADRPAQIDKCEAEGVYYAVATGTLTDEQYETYKSYEYYVGAIGPDLATEYQAGYDMAKHFLDEGYTKFGMFTGASVYFTEMHIYRAAGMLAAMCDAGGADYKGATGMGIVGVIFNDGGVIEPCTIGTVELNGVVSGYDFDDAWFGKLAAVANDPNVEALLAVGSGQVTFAGFKPEGKVLGDIDCYTADSVGLMEAGTLNYLAGKFSASIGPIFAATLSAVYGEPIRDENGNALALSQGYWVASDAATAKQYFEVDSSTTAPAYTKEKLDTLFGASYNDFASFVSKYSFDEIQK
ncbi:MAG: LacI family DNA-binding transcriptional regulator [Oscillospiraceae bacterium]|nr:LacI family DNA-binding transcriptional regulator [Oscillospiraceae bacterium]